MNTITPDKTAKRVQFARENFFNDGAEGETVHYLCDAVEVLEAEVEELKRTSWYSVWLESENPVDVWKLRSRSNDYEDERPSFLDAINQLVAASGYGNFQTTIERVTEERDEARRRLENLGWHQENAVKVVNTSLRFERERNEERVEVARLVDLLHFIKRTREEFHEQHGLTEEFVEFMKQKNQEDDD